MKILRESTTKGGLRRVTVELPHGEVLLSVDKDGYYGLGYPLEDVVRGRTITDAARVFWCEVSQKWVS